MRHHTIRSRLVLAAAPAALMALAGCSAASLPDPSEVKLLPSASSFLPPKTNEFAKATVNSSRPVAAGDLVDGQGACAGGAVAAAAEPGATDVPSMPRGVGLDMTECQVVQVIGPAQSTEIGTNERGERSVVMTYTTREQAGIYRFVGGRLTSVERSGEPPAPEKPGKKPQKPAKRQQPT